MLDGEALERAQAFFEHCRDGDLAGAVAQTDVKGDRSLADLGWHLDVPPLQPPASVAVVLGWAVRNPSWDRYLGLTQTPEAVAPAV